MRKINRLQSLFVLPPFFEMIQFFFILKARFSLGMIIIKNMIQIMSTNITGIKIQMVEDGCRII